MPAAFSRLQLAAALLEYDNDPDNPDAPRRSAQESAIFAHLRRNPAAPPQTTSRQSDYLGVSLPSETGSAGGRESAVGTRRSRASIDALRNPFGADSNDEEEAEEEMEVDLTSWGLDALMPKERSKKGKGKAASVAATAPPTTTVRSHVPSTRAEQFLQNPRRAVSYSRSMSMGNNLDFQGEFGSPHQFDGRRRSIGSPLDVANMDINRTFLARPRSHSASLMQGLIEAPQAVPFPTGSTRAISPGPTESVSSRRLHERTFSMASMNSRMLLADVQEESRPHSTYEEEVLPQEDNPFALKPPSQTSRFDPKYAAHGRTISNVSMGTRALLNDDQNSVMTGADDNPHRERRYSTTLELLRPKILVMPSPLQSAPAPAPPVDHVRDGFTLSKDGPPLPPGARSSRRASTLLGNFDAPAPIASNSFTPNPLNDLTSAQKLFRNTLAVEGHFDAYSDDLPRAKEDGEQIELYPEEQPVEEEPLPLPSPPPPPPPPPETSSTKRPAGKLYGKSLIDDLESRKAHMRSKQRVFTGDQRPSMMARGEIRRSSTLIDPATLTRPTSQFLSTPGSAGGLIRRQSGNIKPLLSFEDDKIPQNSPMSSRLPTSRSVFGVDKLWEREMAKLREIEAQEKLEEEMLKKKEEEDEKHKAEKRGKKKRKGKKVAQAQEVPEVQQDLQPPQRLVSSGNAGQRVSIEPPVLPAIQRATRRPPPPPVDDDEEDEDEESGDEPIVSNRQDSEPAWHAGSSDEEGGEPRRTTGVGPRYPAQRAHNPVEPDSDEDLPLVATLNKALRPNQQIQRGDSDNEDEEKPLAALLRDTKLKQSSSRLDINFDKTSAKGPSNNSDDEDDDQPLGLRASRVPPGLDPAEGGDEDDRPLGLHPEQQRRTQYGFFPQQQQPMMMQAQMHNSMFFNPPMMGSGFFPPPMVTPMMNPMSPMMMMQAPVPIPSPPPVHDTAKFGRVDKWRRDVAVEGER